MGSRHSRFNYMGRLMTGLEFTSLLHDTSFTSLLLITFPKRHLIPPYLKLSTYATMSLLTNLTPKSGAALSSGTLVIGAVIAAV